MTVEGMWKFQSGSVEQPEVLRWGGIVVLETNRVFGGDSVMAWIGKYEVDRDDVRATVRSWRWNSDVGDEMETVFGMSGPVDHMVEINGRRAGSVITGELALQDQPHMRLPIRMEKIADLP